MLTNDELRARYAKWSERLTNYVAANASILGKLEKHRVESLKAATKALDDKNTDVDEQIILQAESDLWWFAAENVRNEYCRVWDRLRVMRDAAKFELEDRGETL